MSDNMSVVSDLWSKFVEDRQARDSSSWMFAPDHPRLRKMLYDTYLAGLDPFTWVRGEMPHLPARHGLEIGCGGGDLAIAMVQTGLCARLDAFDVAKGAVEAARKKAVAAGVETIDFFVSDANSVKLPEKRYDFVCASHALHHVENLEGLFDQVARALVPDGLFFADDYIGPSRMQYSDDHIAYMNRLLSSLPESKRRSRFTGGTVKTHIERVPVERFIEIDPSEGVRAGEIVSLLKNDFDVEIIPTGMSLMYEVLIGIIHNFDPDDLNDNALLDLVFFADTLYNEIQKGSPCFACLVARRKSPVVN